MNTSTPNTCQKCGKPILAGSPRGLCALCLISAVAKTDGPVPSDAPSPELDDLRAIFPQFEILEPIGAGGMGRVYKVRQPNLDRVVALKILPPAYAADPEWVERFTREARALARLNHPNIVQVYDFGETVPNERGERFPFLLMEFVDGVNLRQALRTGTLTSREALTIVPSVCSALQYAHDQGVLHRDIKPENILLDTLGRVKIADFGLAKLHDDKAAGLTLTASGAQLGTAAYMAPEQIEKPHDVDHRADIYSLGVVFYELLTGELPLGRFPAPSEKSGTDPRLDTIVFRTLEKERDRRFQTATAMQTEVENVASHPAPESIAPTAPPPQQSAQPRLCKMAVTGTILVSLGIPFLLGAAILVGLILPQTLKVHNDVGVRPVWATLLPILAGILGMLPAIAGTACGWIALGQIRAAAGTLRGAGRATFAALFFPAFIFIAIAPLVLARLFGSSLGGIAGLILAIALVAWISRNLYARANGAAGSEGSKSPVWPWLVGVGALACILLLPAAGLLVPYFTLHASRESAALGSDVVTADVVTPDRAPFVGMLSQGSVELRAVAHHPAGAEGWWGMNGAPVAAPTAGLNTDPDQTPKAGERAFTFVLETKDLPPGTTLQNCDVPNSRGWSFHHDIRPIDEKRMSGPVALSARLPAHFSKADIRAGFEIGDWTTIFETGPQSIGGATPAHEGTRWKLSWSSAIERKDGVVVSHWNVPRVPEWGSRVVLMKKDGTLVSTNDHTTGQDESEWRFSGVPLAEIGSFGFQVRRVQWIEFRDIPLVPISSGK